jgi:tetratricopeptide (TPR) repeat protein
MPEPPKYDFDVFISYSRKDEEWVTKTLLPRLEQVGLKVCIDFRDFQPGKPALFNMQYAVRHSQRTLLVLTGNWIASEWTLFESLLATTKHPAGLQPRLIPLLLEKCEMPETADFIAALTYVDFTRPDFGEGTWRVLLTACGKAPEQEGPEQPERDDWFLAHPYPMPPNFTGRLAERKMLTGWLNTNPEHPLLVLHALGGFGKSALAWHWLLNDVGPGAWPRVVWWSFYEGDASFDHFLTETSQYLRAKTKSDKISGLDPIKAIVEILHSPGTLLILDGFERALRAFGGLNAAYQGDKVTKSEMNDRDCISPLAELFLYNVALHPNLRSKVLLTTRLCPRVLEAKGGGFLQGCCEEELKQMQPVDAAEFFHAQGIRGTHTEIEQACAPYGFHPLSLQLLAGWIVNDLQQPGDIVAAKRLDIAGDLVAKQHHVLEQAYDSLIPNRKKLLSRIACFRSPVKYEALKALAETESSHGESVPKTRGEMKPRKPRVVRGIGSSETLDADLRDLVARGLLHHDRREGRFDLHPIVRRYAYDRLTAPDRASTHTRLRDYFAAVPKANKVTRLEDLAPVIELYHHTVRAGQFDEAFTLFRDRLENALYYQVGAYQLIIDLLRPVPFRGKDSPPRPRDKRDQAWMLNDLANSYSLSGQPRQAVPLFEASNNIDERRGSRIGLAIGLGNLAYMAQLPIGVLRAAEFNLRRSIGICREMKDKFNEAIGHHELGRVLAYRGSYPASEAELTTAMEFFERLDYTQGQGITWAYRGLSELFLLRTGTQSGIRKAQSAIVGARRALELADATARVSFPVERDYVRAHWLMGAAYRIAGQPNEAERHLHEALERCRRINLVEFEGDILIETARLRAATGSSDEAQRLDEEALLITERSSYVLQGADARLELAKLALGRGDKATALEHAKKARELATCDGPPDYTYKVAYDEAGALLEQLGQDIP